MFAVLAVRFEFDESLIDPAVAVIVTAVVLIAPLINALAPRFTCRPAVNVIVPIVELTVEVIVKSPTLVADVIEIFTLPVTAAATLTVRPAVNVIVPSVEVIAAVVVKSPVVVVAVSDVFIPALKAPLIAIPRPELIVIVPNEELTPAPIVISLVAPTVVNDTFPNPPAVIAPVVVSVPADTDNVIFPVVLVVIAATLTFPVDAV